MHQKNRIAVDHPSDTLFLRPSLLSKWNGLRGLAELVERAAAEVAESRAVLDQARVEDPLAAVLDRAVRRVLPPRPVARVAWEAG